MSRFEEEWLDGTPFVTAHTSGSTGQPKEIKLLKEDMRLSARATNRFFSITSDSLLALPLSEDYIAGKMMHIRAMEAKSQLLVEPPSRFPFRNYAGREIDLVAIVPQQIEGLIGSPNKFRHIIVGGAPVSSRQEEAALRHRAHTGSSWWATYGMTETCSHVALRKFGEPTYQALPSVSFSTDPRGCLVIECRGASWSPVVTNDMVKLITPESFIWLGRADNVVMSGGLKLHPELIEKKIETLMEPHAFFLTSRPSELWGEELVMVIEGEFTPAQLSDYGEKIAGILPSQERPKQIIAKATLPRTTSGKLLRRL